MNAKTSVPRPIIATFHTNGKNPDLPSRHYSKLDNAIPRATQLMMTKGRPGDVVEFSHAVTGKQLGTVKVKAGGKIDTWFIWDEEQAPA